MIGTMTFVPARLPSSNRVISVGLAACLGMFAAVLFWLGLPMVGVTLLAAMLVAFGGDYCRRSVGYRVEGTELVIQRRCWPSRRFRMTGVVERFRDRNALRRASGAMLMGGGLQPGRPQLTGSPTGVGEPYRVHTFATDLSHAVRVGVRHGTVLITPEDPDAFIAAARRAPSIDS